MLSKGAIQTGQVLTVAYIDCLSHSASSIVPLSMNYLFSLPRYLPIAGFVVSHGPSEVLHLFQQLRDPEHARRGWRGAHQGGRE